MESESESSSLSKSIAALAINAFFSSIEANLAILACPGRIHVNGNSSEANNLIDSLCTYTSNTYIHITFFHFERESYLVLIYLRVSMIISFKAV